VLYEIATGRRPFDETQTGRLTDAILHTPVTPPTQLQPGVNPELERITLKCLERDPESRYFGWPATCPADQPVDQKACCLVRVLE
jgi:eukaryotic-like serine/threonine-protein kinase